jgi:predicted aminopeptidase
LTLVASCAACSPIYVLKAGIAEARILRARQPITRVVNDSTVDPDTRAKLAWVLETRRFAAEELGIDVGESYTMYTELESDTLALVLSAAPKDRLTPKTWWFPIVGRVPYKGYFSESGALNDQQDLEAEGYDTYLRPTAAFSTLGWFNDPVLSTALRTDDVEVVTTVLHELSHQYLFVPGQVGFNESFATFAGRVGAIRFFCGREGGGPDTVRCQRAQARWRDYQRFSSFLDGFVRELETIYGDASLTFEQKVARREAIFEAGLENFDAEVAPNLEAIGFTGFRRDPLNNATLLSRIRYYNRLADFNALLAERDGDLTSTLTYLREGTASMQGDAFQLLPRGSPSPSRPPTASGRGADPAR